MSGYININLSQCKKNIVRDASIYDKFEKSCTNTFSSSGKRPPSQPQSNPLIYCPSENDGTTLTPIVDDGNIYCSNSRGEPVCVPKVNPFSQNNQSEVVVEECKDDCKPKSSFFTDGIEEQYAATSQDCKTMCENTPNNKCTGYTFYDNKCIMYSVDHNDYYKYQLSSTSTIPTKNNSDITTEKVFPIETETNGFPCKSQFSNYKQTANPNSLDQCINDIVIINESDPSDDTRTKLKLIDAVKDLSCQYAACTTEYKKADGSMDFFQHANTLGGEVSYYLNNGEYKDYLRWLYGLSGAIVFYMIIRFFLYKIVGGFGGQNKYNIFKALFGNNDKSSIWAFIIPSLLTALATVVPLSIGKFAPALYTTIVCTTILILMLAVINIILTLRGFTNWRLPGGFQLLFMIIIIVISLAGSIYFLYESIKDRDYGSSPIESEAPFIVIPKVHNYGYIALMVTGGVSLIALLVIVKELFSNMKTAQYRGTDTSVKSNTKGLGIIASALYGIFGGFNMTLAVFAPFLLLTFAIFERIFGSIITKASNGEGFMQNLMINIGTAIHEASGAAKSRRRIGNVDNEYLKIGQEFFGGGPSNGWAPFGTTLLNIILGMMTNYNFVLSRTEIPETRTAGRYQEAEMPSNIRVLDKEMWFTRSHETRPTTGLGDKIRKATSTWFTESNNRSPLR